METTTIKWGGDRQPCIIIIMSIATTIGDMSKWLQVKTIAKAEETGSKDMSRDATGTGRTAAISMKGAGMKGEFMSRITTGGETQDITLASLGAETEATTTIQL